MSRAIKSFQALLMTLLVITNVHAQHSISFESGVYENLFLAVSKDENILGYYRERQGEDIVKSCTFSFKGEAKHSTAKIIVSGEKSFPGKIIAGTDEVNLQIEKGRELPGCGAVLIPEIANGINFDLITKAPWSDLKIITSEKSYFHSEPKTDKQMKGYLVKGDVVGVVAIQNDWMQVDYYSNNGKMTRGWINSHETASLQSIN
ncbi:MAG: hypothetical protein EOO52_14815 [Gammaproteobacteria bacterium]|nr:MAG: hypothetical protein EOO52_14815 [Gammaproteobacteria bacterium]